MEPDYLHDLDVCFNHSWTPFPNEGCGGDLPPTNIIGGIQTGGGDNFCSPPWQRIQGKFTRREILGKISL
jgi:hypothetical protein